MEGVKDVQRPDTTSSAWPNWHRARPEHGSNGAGAALTRDSPGQRTLSLTQINDNLDRQKPHLGLVHHRKQPSSTPC